MSSTTSVPMLGAEYLIQLALFSCSTDPESIRKCSHCQYTGKLSTFPQGKNLSYLKKCQTCNARDRARAKKARAGDTSSSTNDHAELADHLEAQKRVDWDAFIEIVSGAKNTTFSYSYLVDLETLCLEITLDVEEEKDECEESGLQTAEDKDKNEEYLEIGSVARRIARIIWTKTGFRFMYVFISSLTCLLIAYEYILMQL
ncbi:hypothetical protein F5878DRAFT_311514 [Lentinula raphanica]|uniref:Uncharacterized protein n=1 Tax=Lentinula raphanica TaxID=153919 RepID=A0AA38UA67_9AGAR|nr:hypothetical protein F5878DRAFT_311514 [Lentinula raphanica]